MLHWKLWDRKTYRRQPQSENQLSHRDYKGFYTIGMLFTRNKTNCLVLYYAKYVTMGIFPRLYHRWHIVNLLWRSIICHLPAVTTAYIIVDNISHRKLPVNISYAFTNPKLNVLSHSSDRTLVLLVIEFQPAHPNPW